jgi:hypothetical protein
MSTGNMSPPIARIPRWVVERDPTWEKSIDPSPMTLKWTKKGTDVKAVSHPGSIYCDIIREVHEATGLPDISSSLVNYSRIDLSVSENVTKYLSSRYLNPRFSKPLSLDNMI